MAGYRKATASLIAAALCLSAGAARAEDWSYYDDDYHGSYDWDHDSYYDGYHDGYHARRGDAAGALALGVIGGVALGSAISRPAVRYLQVEPYCVKTWKKFWNPVRGKYQRKRVLICD